ncbi:MAG: BatA domain-containing protein, partial [Gemmatimonadales bacterium]
MSFVHPWALLGLFAAAIPALLHLLQRRTPPELDFPPLRYLSDAERRSARRMKLRHVLLLVLRTALIVVIVAAAARPQVPAPRATVGGGGTHAPTALGVVLDNSPSSGVMVDGRPLLERLRSAAAGSLRAATAADRLWLMLADGVARTGTPEALVAAVERVTTDWRRLDLVAAVRRAGRLTEAEPLAAREVHVFSDLQRTALSDGRADVPPGVRVLVHAGSAAPGLRLPPNRGLARVRVTDVGGGGG